MPYVVRPGVFRDPGGGAKKHGEVNYTLGADIPYTIVDKSNPIMAGMTDITIFDEAFFNMTWAQDPKNSRACDCNHSRDAERRDPQG